MDMPSMGEKLGRSGRGKRDRVYTSFFFWAPNLKVAFKTKGNGTPKISRKSRER